MAVNPWQVDSVQAFSFLKCPECTFEIQEEHYFQVHAVENHPLSFVLFGKRIKEEGFNEHCEISEENYQDFYENHDFEDPISTDYLQIKQEEVEIKESNNLKEENIEVEKKSHCCLLCNASFDRSGLLKRHVESVHEEKQPAHMCSVCDKSFSAKDKLKRHTNSVHMEKKPHKCPICDKSYDRNDTLKKHKKLVHEEVKSHKCSVCEKSYAEKTALSRHEESVHK